MLIKRKEVGNGIVLLTIIGRLEFSGRIDLLNASDIANSQRLIIDLSLLTHITLEGVQALANIAIERGVAKDNIFFIEPQEEQVRAKIDAVGISQYLTVFPNLETALSTLEQS